MRSIIMRMNKIFLFISGVILLLMTVQIGIGALARGLFNIAIEGNVEVAKYYYMVALSALSLGAVQAAREHVIVEVFTQWMSAGAIKILDGFALVFTMAYSAILTLGCTLAAIDAFETREFYRLLGFDIALWPPRWFLAIGLIGFLLTALTMVISRKQKLDGGIV